MHGSLIIGYDFSNKDDGVLIVGIKHPNQEVDIINAFQGKEAANIFTQLITKKNGGEND